MVESTDHVNRILVAVTQLPQAMFWRAGAGTLYTRTGIPVRANVEGTPDIMGCYRGRAVGIECKFGRGRLNDNQKLFRAAWEPSGGAYIVGRSVEQVLADLAAL